MPGCILRVGGKNFDPEAFLATSGLQAYRTWQAGQPLNKSGHRPERVYKDSGFQCDVSTADGDLKQQLLDAEQFLTQHHHDLVTATSHPSVDYADLDYGYYCRLGGGTFMHGEYLPLSFLLLAGQAKVGVALSLYPSATEGWR